jgi:hypothetical protein
VGYEWNSLEEYEQLARDLHLMVEARMDVFALGILVRSFCDVVEVINEDFDREHFITTVLNGEQVDEASDVEEEHHQHRDLLDPDCPECQEILERQDTVAAVIMFPHEDESHEDR